MTLPLQPRADWCEELRDRISRPPAQARAALALALDGHGGAATVGSIEPALAQRARQAGLALRCSGAAWHVGGTPAVPVDVVLADIARWLHASGLTSPWRDERVSVADDTGARHAAIERAAVRPLGIATHAVHLVVRDPGGAVWVQQRAFDKSTDPGCWDTTVGGLIAAGEPIALALQRETEEEAGLDVRELAELAYYGRLTVRRPVKNGYMVEHIEMFEALLDEARAPVNQDGEVACFECLGVAELLDRLHADAFTVEAAAVLLAWLERRAAPAR